MVHIQKRHAGHAPNLEEAERGGAIAENPGFFARIRRHLEQRPDSEHETALNRFGLCACALLYLIGASLFGNAEAHRTLVELSINFAIYNVFAICIFCAILSDLRISPFRRVVSICADAGCVCYLIHMGDSGTALFYPLLLWIIFGNGFRFGVRYLVIAAAVCAVTFSAVIVTTPFWRENLSLASGLIVGQIVLPAYVSILIRKLSEAKRQAEEANRTKSLFLASVTHELRTPLNAIICFSDLLSEMARDEEQVDMSRTIAMAGRSLLGLINSILDFSQREAKKSPIRLQTIDLFALLANTRDMLAIQAHTRGLWLTLHITPRTPQFVFGELRCFEEVLVNLTGNALKFTEKGYVGIFVDALETNAGKIKFRIEVRDTGIGIAPEAQKRIFESFTQADETIIDRFGGSGLGLANVKQLVEAHGGQVGVESAVGAGSKFWVEFECQSSEEPAPELLRGSAPWLLLSEDCEIQSYMQNAGAVVERFSSIAMLQKSVSSLKAALPHHRPVIILDQRSLGAELETAARQLRGDDPASAPVLVALKENSSVEIAANELYLTTLPRPLDALSFKNMWQHVTWHERKKKERLIDSEAKVTSIRPLSILVAEDNRTNQKVIAKILQRAGHSVHLVENGELALETLVERPFDVALVDLNMPVLNGIEMTKLYRFASTGRPRLPIIALTADATAEAKIRCAEAGMDECLTKPVEPNQLLGMLNTIAGSAPKAPIAGDAVKPESLDFKDKPALETPSVPGDEISIDIDTLSYLRKLGGKDFVEDLLEQYVSDAARMLRDLNEAVAEEDLPKFQDQVHALRSCSANVGAKAIYNLCLSWREIDAYDLAVRGEEHMKALEAEFAKAKSALSLYENE